MTWQQRKMHVRHHYHRPPDADPPITEAEADLAIDEATRHLEALGWLEIVPDIPENPLYVLTAAGKAALARGDWERVNEEP
jgi:hypothetical protein